MHELPVIKKVLDVCLKHGEANKVEKIVAIHLKVSEFSDLLPEWMQRYFDYVSKDTIAEEAKLKITRMPLVMQCNTCDSRFEVSRDDKKPCCLECRGTNFRYVSGKGYCVENMEVA